MSKKRVLNIKAQEIVTDGRRSVRYRGSDGKMHDLASSENGSAEPGPAESPATAQLAPLIVHVDETSQYADVSTDEVIEAIDSGRQVIYNVATSNGGKIYTNFIYTRRVNASAPSQVKIELKDFDYVHINNSFYDK